MAPNRLAPGVALRLSRYLRVLEESKRMGRRVVSSQAISEATSLTAGQIRRDLSGFGRFGTRGVGYDVDTLIAQIRRILRSSSQHS